MVAWWHLWNEVKKRPARVDNKQPNVASLRLSKIDEIILNAMWGSEGIMVRTHRSGRLSLSKSDRGTLSRELLLQ